MGKTKGVSWEQLIGTNPTVIKGLTAKKKLDPLLLNRWTPFVRAFILNPGNIKDLADQAKRGWAGEAYGYDLEELITDIAIKEDGEVETGNWLLPLGDSFTQFESDRGHQSGARRGGIGIKSLDYTYNAQDMTIADIVMKVEFNHSTDLNSFKGQSLFKIGQEMLIQFGWSVPKGAMPVDNKAYNFADVYESIENLVQNITGAQTPASAQPVDVDLTDRAAGTSMWIRATHYSFDLKFQKDGSLLGTYKLMDGDTLDLQQQTSITKKDFDVAMTALPGPPPQITEVIDGEEVPVTSDLSSLGQLDPKILAIEEEYLNWPKEGEDIKTKFQVGNNNRPWGDLAPDAVEEVGWENGLKGLDLAEFVRSMSTKNDYYQLGDVLEATYRAYLYVNAENLPKGALKARTGEYKKTSGILYADIQSSNEGYFAVAMPWIITEPDPSIIAGFSENTSQAYYSLFTNKSIVNKTSDIRNVYQLPVPKDQVDAYFQSEKSKGASLKDIYDVIIDMLPNTFELQFKPSLDNKKRILYWPAEQHSKIKTKVNKSWSEKEEQAMVGDGFITFDWGTRHGLVDSVDFEMAITPDLLYNTNIPLIQGKNVISGIQQMKWSVEDPVTDDLTHKGIIVQKVQQAVTSYVGLHPDATYIPNDYLNRSITGDNGQIIDDWQDGLALFLDDQGNPIIDPFVNFRHWYSGVKLVTHGFVGLEGLTVFQINADIPGLDKCVYATTMIKHQVTPDNFTTNIQGYQYEGVDLGTIKGELSVNMDSKAVFIQKKIDADALATFGDSQESLIDKASALGQPSNTNWDAEQEKLDRYTTVMKGDLSLFERMQYALIRNPSIGATAEQQELAMADGDPADVQTDLEVSKLMALIIKINLKLAVIEEKIEKKSREVEAKIKQKALQVAQALFAKGVALIELIVAKLTGFSGGALKAFVKRVKKIADKVKKVTAKAAELKAMIAEAQANIDDLKNIDEQAKLMAANALAEAEAAAAALGTTLPPDDWDKGTSFFDAKRDPNFDFASKPDTFVQKFGEPWSITGVGLAQISEVSVINQVLDGPALSPRTVTREKTKTWLDERKAKKAKKIADKIADAQIMADTGVNRKTAKEYRENPLKWMVIIPNKKRKPGQYDTYMFIPRGKENNLKDIIRQTGIPLWEILDYNTFYALEFADWEPGDELDPNSQFFDTPIAAGQNIKLPIRLDRYIDHTEAATYEKYMFAGIRPAEPTGEAPPIAVWYAYKVKEGDTLPEIAKETISNHYGPAFKPTQTPLAALVEINTKDLKSSDAKFHQPPDGLIIHNVNKKQRWEDINLLQAIAGTVSYELIVGEPIWVPFPTGMQIPDDSVLLSAEQRQAKAAAKVYKDKIENMSALVFNAKAAIDGNADLPYIKARNMIEYAKEFFTMYRDAKKELLEIAIENDFITQDDFDLEIKDSLSKSKNWGLDKKWPEYKG